MKQEHEVGRAYWLRDGREVEYLALTADGQHVVAPVIELETYDGREFARGPVEFAAELFTKAPVEKRSEEIVALEVKVRELEKRKAELYAECINSEREIRARLDKLKKYEGLDLIEDFIDGKITHLVYPEEYGPGKYEIKSVDSLDIMEYGRKKGLRLVSLFGASGGKLRWRVNEYYDGSGSWKEIIPCGSLEEAQQKRLDRIQADMMEQFQHMQPDRPWWFLRLYEAAVDAGIAPPYEVCQRYEKLRKVELEAEEVKLQKALVDAQDKLLAHRSTKMVSA